MLGGLYNYIFDGTTGQPFDQSSPFGLRTEGKLRERGTTCIYSIIKYNIYTNILINNMPVSHSSVSPEAQPKSPEDAEIVKKQAMELLKNNDLEGAAKVLNDYLSKKTSVDKEELDLSTEEQRAAWIKSTEEAVKRAERSPSSSNIGMAGQKCDSLRAYVQAVNRVEYDGTQDLRDQLMKWEGRIGVARSSAEYRAINEELQKWPGFSVEVGDELHQAESGEMNASWVISNEKREKIGSIKYGVGHLTARLAGANISESGHVDVLKRNVELSLLSLSDVEKLENAEVKQWARLVAYHSRYLYLGRQGNYSIGVFKSAFRKTKDMDPRDPVLQKYLSELGDSYFSEKESKK